MKTHPILFNAPMVRALLDGSKTQTRRIVKPNPHNGWDFELPPIFGHITSPHPKKGKFGAFIRRGFGTDFPEADLIVCPYGKPGDQLWAREAWRTLETADAMPPRDLSPAYRIWYETQNDVPFHESAFGKLRPSMFMPRWASRITLEITGVRVERLQDISEEDAIAEGIERFEYGGQVSWRNYSLNDEWAAVSPMLASPSDSYRALWESINGPGSWDENPWVWAISFKVIKP